MPDNDGVTISEVSEVTPELVKAWERLMPQLSRRAATPSAEWLKQVIDSDSVLFVAESEGEIVGSLTLVLTRIPVGLKAWIEDVVVDEQARGKRIGEQLSRAAIEYAQHAGARNINLESHPSREAAHKLYNRIGFRTRESFVYRYDPDND